MWKKLKDSDAMSKLSVHKDSQVDISDLFALPPVSSPANFRRDRSSIRKQKQCSVSLLDADPEEWTEDFVYYFLKNKPNRLPSIIEIIEMRVRRVGGHKFLCKFLNSKHQECTVWVGNIQLARLYPSKYNMAKEEFANMAQR
tara:strand:+ start:1154 stop:1579 length:426 start_codon:yes stop_codon:yes gene_type:complete